MKNQTIIKLSTFIIMMMFAITLANAQTCPGNRILVFHCYRGGCVSKCVNPNNIPAGWSPYGCGLCPGMRQTESIDTDETSLTEVYPNPVSNSATISFSLEQSEKVSVQIFDINGRWVTTLANSELSEGQHEIQFNSENLDAGIYILKLETGNYSETKKLSVVR